VFAEPLAAAFQVTAQVHITPSDRVAVIGAGKLGLLVAQVLKLTGCDLVVVARQPRPIGLLKKWAIPYVDSRQDDWLTRVGRRSRHIVVDCTGSSEGFAAALELCRARGTIVLKSTYTGLPQADLTRVVVEEIRVVGSRCGPFAAALRALQLELVDVQSMIDKVYSLEDAPTAFVHAAERGVLKVLLRP
jgi:threonine dehydrogenase-like Zn-dependent dehydrogenase